MKRTDYGFPIISEAEQPENLTKAIFGFDIFARPMNGSLTNVAAKPNRLAEAQKQAAEARSRNFPAPCTCAVCESAEKLPAVQRILAKWTPLDRT